MAADNYFMEMFRRAEHYNNVLAAVYEFEEGQRPRTEKVMQNVADQFNVSVAEMKVVMYYEPTFEDWEKHDEKYAVIIPIETEGEKHD